MDLEENQEINGPANFDEAGLAAANMFAEDETNAELNDGEQSEMPPQEQQPPGEIPPQIQQQPPPEVILQRAFGEMQALKAENERLQQAMAQMSEANKQNIVDEAMAMPVLDLSTLAFDDENTLRQKQGQYAQDMAKYIQGTMMKELSPFIEQAREGMAQKQKNEVITALAALPELQDFNAMLPQLDKIIANNKALAGDNIPLDEKYITAYLIAAGINSRNKAKELEAANAMTPDKFMQFYQSNPEIRDLIDKQRLAEIQGAQGVPPLSPSSGAVNAALTIPKTPESFDEALELSKRYFG